jgi:serine/threonine-protein phosphatase PGAM5
LGTRTLILVRHGQYNAERGGVLTDLGRQQARKTAEWLAQHLDGQRIDALWSSTLPRAKETAAIVAGGLPASAFTGKPGARAVGVLREGMYTKVKGYETTASERLEDRARADAAYARFFRSTRSDRLEIVVCHGNLIRYLVCRAIDVPVGRWTRLNSHHCAVTRVLVRDTGAIRVVSYNETAHLPPQLVT